MSIPLISGLVFGLTFGLSCYFGLRVFGRSGRALHRLGAGVKPSQTASRRLATRWPAVLSAAAHLIASGGSSAEVHRKLTLAGYAHAASLERFHGAQVLGALALSAMVATGTAFLGLSTSSRVTTILAGALVGFRLPYLQVARRIKRRATELQRSLPNAVDLLIVCIESGLGLDQALRTVAKELSEPHPELSRELVFLNAEIAAGKSRVDALRNLAERTGVEDLRDLVSALVQADRFGTSICQTLRTRSEYLRVQARQRAEEKAAKLAVKLVFPIFFFILPTLFVVTLGPAVFHLLHDLMPAIESM
jgi:tight adherence protein C